MSSSLYGHHSSIHYLYLNMQNRETHFNRTERKTIQNPTSNYERTINMVLSVFPLATGTLKAPICLLHYCKKRFYQMHESIHLPSLWSIFLCHQPSEVVGTSGNNVYIRKDKAGKRVEQISNSSKSLLLTLLRVQNRNLGPIWRWIISALQIYVETHPKDAVLSACLAFKVSSVFQLPEGQDKMKRLTCF